MQNALKMAGAMVCWEMFNNQIFRENEPKLQFVIFANFWVNYSPCGQFHTTKVVTEGSIGKQGRYCLFQVSMNWILHSTCWSSMQAA